MVPVYKDADELTVQGLDLFGMKFVAFSAKRPTLNEEARFSIYIYNRSIQMAPTASISFSETQVAPLLALMKEKKDFSLISEDGKTLVFEASSNKLAISQKRKKKPAFTWLCQEMINTLLRPDVHADIFQMLSLRMPALA